MTATRIALVSLGLLATFERFAHACPFCGGKGASGLLQNLILVGAFWFGARALMRAAKRRRSEDRPPAAQSAGEPSSSTPRTDS
jgi:hypothetical protein